VTHKEHLIKVLADALARCSDEVRCATSNAKMREDDLARHRKEEKEGVEVCESLLALLQEAGADPAKLDFARARIADRRKVLFFSLAPSCSPEVEATPPDAVILPVERVRFSNLSVEQVTADGGLPGVDQPDFDPPLDLRPPDGAEDKQNPPPWRQLHADPQLQEIVKLLREIRAGQEDQIEAAMRELAILARKKKP
jgi:hypothetical protein